MKKQDKQSLLINAASIFAAPFTGGLSLAGLAIPFIFGGDDDNSAKLEEIKMSHEQWKIQFEANQKERERLWQEKQANLQAIKNNSDEVARLNAIISDPNRTSEEKENARKRIILLEDEVKKLKEKNSKLDKDIEQKDKFPSVPSRPWGSYLPNLKLIDKIILAGGMVLVIYLLIPENKKK